MHVESERPVKGGARHGGWWHNLPDQFTAPPPIMTLMPKALLADTESVDQVYRALLAGCPLSEKHKDYLTGPKCQIPVSELAGYGTLPELWQRPRLSTALVKQFGRPTLLTVPGFFENEHGVGIAGQGLLVAMVGANGLIAGMQARQATGGYRWLSSASKGGPSSGSPAHVVRGNTITTVGLTEGGKKAHIWALRAGLTTIGIAGHGTHAAGIAALKQLVVEGALCVIIALDADDPDKPELVAAVEVSRQRLAQAALSSGFSSAHCTLGSGSGQGR